MERGITTALVITAVLLAGGAALWHRVSSETATDGREVEAAMPAPAVDTSAPSDAPAERGVAGGETPAAPTSAVVAPDDDRTALELELELERLRTSIAARDAKLERLENEIAARAIPKTLEEDLERLKGDLRRRDEAIAEMHLVVASLEASIAAAEAGPAPGASGGPLAEVHFERASAALTPGGETRALAAIEAMKEMPLAAVRIVGHTDTTGDPEANDRLSRARAEAVADFLVANGIAPSLVEVAWLGEKAPPVATRDGVSEPLNRCVGIIPVLAETTAAN